MKEVNKSKFSCTERVTTEVFFPLQTLVCLFSSIHNHLSDIDIPFSEVFFIGFLRQCHNN